jgi:hypothetical protein
MGLNPGVLAVDPGPGAPINPLKLPADGIAGVLLLPPAWAPAVPAAKDTTDGVMLALLLLGGLWPNAGEPKPPKDGAGGGL